MAEGSGEGWLAGATLNGVLREGLAASRGQIPQRQEGAGQADI